MTSIKVIREYKNRLHSKLHHIHKQLKDNKQLSIIISKEVCDIDK